MSLEVSLKKYLEKHIFNQTILLHNLLSKKNPEVMSDTKAKEFFKLGEVGNYFVNIFKKPDPNKPTNFNLRMMHGINKISILIFLFAIIFWTVKRFI